MFVIVDAGRRALSYIDCRKLDVRMLSPEH